MPSHHRSIGLDVLRAVAILMVLVCHSVPLPDEAGGWGSAAFHVVRRGCWPGVDLFFVLSGFLVGGLLFHEYRATGTLKLGRFFLRRGFKIYPPYWAFMAALVAWMLWSGRRVGLSNLLAELFFFQNYVEGLWATNWSLAVEEHFYLLLPVSILLVAGRGRSEQPFRQLPWLFACLATACLVCRTSHAGVPYHIDTHIKPTHLRLDGLFFGALLAWRHVYHHERMVQFCRRYRWLLLAGGVAGFLPAFFFPLDTSVYMDVFGFIPQWLGAGALICFVLGRTASPRRTARALAAIGRTSYATYLWHLWVGYYWLPGLAALLGWRLNWGGLTVGYYASTLAVGFLFTAWIEKPFLRWRDRLVPAPPRAPASHEPAATALLHTSAATD